MNHLTLNLDVNYLVENDNILSGVDLMRFFTDMYKKALNDVVTVGQTMMKDEEIFFSLSCGGWKTTKSPSIT